MHSEDSRIKLFRKQGLYDPANEHDSCGVGFVCNIKGERTNKIVQQGIEVLKRLAHRGATGSDPKTGDGAGILMQIPHEFLQEVCDKEGVSLPELGSYGTGLIFLPRDNAEREFCKKTVNDIVAREGQDVLWWRTVPVDNSCIGVTAKETEPVIEQVFIKRGASPKDQLAFERKLYIIRKSSENAVRGSALLQKSCFYITNLSSRTISYKGLLMPDQLDAYFLDLQNQNLKSAISLVHSRYSTNTFPTWDLSQPFRFLAHNGEINTLRGNINWMKAKEGQLESELFGKDIEKLKPIVSPGGSDSAMLDNVFELLILGGRSLSHSMMMLIPAAWEGDSFVDSELRDFYKYNACLMEPWDGPAAIAFTDGTRIGAVLDRNGLRPARYIITKDNTVVMASEVGVLDIDPANIAVSGRLEPGKIFFINTEIGRIIDNAELKMTMAKKLPYSKWVKDNIVDFELSAQSPGPGRKSGLDTCPEAFGYTREDMKVILKPMAETGQEPVGAMGNDTPPAVLSKNPLPSTAISNSSSRRLRTLL